LTDLTALYNETNGTRTRNFRRDKAVL
jgi:hypothetical protein